MTYGWYIAMRLSWLQHDFLSATGACLATQGVLFHKHSRLAVNPRLKPGVDLSLHLAEILGMHLLELELFRLSLVTAFLVNWLQIFPAGCYVGE